MNIENGKVVSFHYTLFNEQGEQLESSQGSDAMSYLHGASNIIAGLENAMAGRRAGDKFTVTVQPAEAYGERKDNHIQRIPIKRLGNNPRPKPGQVLNFQTNQGPVQVTVVKVGKFNLDVDANHPLAGQTLTFNVEVTAVREATEEETSHGHAHGAGGHHHG
ncbi:MAG: peptidylprolyl isomerase [Xanthomonadales bacterium]|nr:peptidylprolyl isomerase [Gammaproteobacteria bacterium]NNE04143.1 peptidylprolyl isomerase [Xanthomonadales bacterium]NNL96030.1 peptidylprolyl isomerase [Xanthomonadales bacterium]